MDLARLRRPQRLLEASARPSSLLSISALFAFTRRYRYRYRDTEVHFGCIDKGGERHHRQPAGSLSACGTVPLLLSNLCLSYLTPLLYPHGSPKRRAPRSVKKLMLAIVLLTLSTEDPPAPPSPPLPPETPACVFNKVCRLHACHSTARPCQHASLSFADERLRASASEPAPASATLTEPACRRARLCIADASSVGAALTSLSARVAPH